MEKQKEKELEKELKEKEKIRKIKKARRSNAKLYPIYKMFSWDLLFFYSIEFLFYTITKKITPSEVLIVSGFYLLFKNIGQIFAVIIADFLGKRKSIILGNILLIFYIIILITLPGMLGVIIADLFCALGYALKTLSETNLLYDSVSTKGGEGIFSKIDAKGGSWYYLLDGVASLTAGYLFVINNYLPMLVCLSFIIISTILSFKFKEVYEVKRKRVKKGTLKSALKLLKEYVTDLKKSSKFILKSNRMKSFILFQIVFYGLIKIMDTYCSNLLTDIGIPEAQFSMIFAVLTLIRGISLNLKEPIEKKFKKRTLTFISLTYIGACIIIGIVSSKYSNNIVIPVILIMFAVLKINASIWYILEQKYLKNFTTEKNRNKITFTYDFIGGLAASICSIFGAILLNIMNVRNAFLIVGLIALACMVVVLDYMRNRFGLKPEQYKKEDIKF